MAQQVAAAWEIQHFNAIASGDCTAGYGGLIMVEHAKKLFEANGHNMLQFQHQQVQQEQPALHQPVIPPPHSAQRVNNLASIVPPATRLKPQTIIPPRPTMLLPLYHPRPTEPLPLPKMTKEERPVRVFKGMAAGLIKALHKQDIIEALKVLNKPSSNMSKKSWKLCWLWL
jgi:hypothetical protein